MIFDLTHLVNEDLPVYPGDPHVKVEQVAEIDKQGYADRLITFGSHNGTHMDAPAHMIAGGKQLKDYPTDRFVVNGVCIDAREGFNTYGVNDPGVAVLFYTGTSSYFNDERYWHDYPVLDNKMVQELIDKNVSVVGVDTGSFDNTDNFPVHKALLGADILLLENLTNLEPLIGKTFELYALPLKLEADGAPARVIAKL